MLPPVTGSPDSAVLEVFFVTLPSANADAELAAVWREADEQKWSTDQRRRLANYGLRFGTAANPAPTVIESLLRSKTSGADGTIARLETEPLVSRKMMSLRFDSPGQVLATEIHPRVPLLQLTDGKLRGEDYGDAQGLFEIVASTADAGRVSIQLTPELHHGQSSQRWAGRDGRFVMEASRPKESYAALATRADLAPGDVLVVGGRKDRPGSLGDFFFSRKAGGDSQRRLLVIRVKSIGE
ncbi:MAG: hypothetical protein MI757_02500 [Pirellulales bacterium]|nr:hypothetical protein [Pirellulales bacterium]